MNDKVEILIEDFKPHFVAFIDILGFKDKVEKLEDEQGNIIKENFKLLADRLAGLKIQEHLANQAKEGGLLYGLKITSISDSLIVSVPCDNAFEGEKNAAMLFIIKLAELQRSLIQYLSLVSRGYATQGNLYHENGVIFGKSYIKAFEGEKNLSHYPRIVIDQNIIEKAKKECENPKSGRSTIFDFLRKDFDGEYFIDYLSNERDFSQYPINHDELKKATQQRLLTLSNPSIRQKYQWLENYLALSK